MSTTLLRWSLLAITVASTVYTKPLSTCPHSINGARAPWTLAPILVAEHPHGTVNNSYIVVLKKDIPVSVMQNHFNFLSIAHEADPLSIDGADSGIRHVYDSHIKGYSGSFTDNVVEKIRELPEVDYIERDQIVRTQTKQIGAPWGLARVSHRKRLTFGTYSKYFYNQDAGEGVNAYVIDTGINVGHVEFEGRASWGHTIAPDGDVDGNGHGTHCAGTIASRKYGVAKAANVIAVKVLNSQGSGPISDVIKGVEWAATDAKATLDAAKAEFKATGKTKHKGSVGNMSLGGGKSRAFEEMVDGAIDGGLHFAVAAGNDGRDACNYSPAGGKKSITVGASTITDDIAYFSNHGTCVDVFGPGLNILSTWTGSPTATNTISGTSMASPHTAGLLAYLLSIYPTKEFDPVLGADFYVPTLSHNSHYGLASAYSIAHSVLPSWLADFLPSPRWVEFVADESMKGLPTLTPAQLKKALLALATKDALSVLPAGSPNLLIYNNATA